MAKSLGSRVLARIFITGCPKWGFKKTGCPNPLTEKKQVIILTIYIDNSSNFMLYFFNKCISYHLRIKLFKISTCKEYFQKILTK